MCVLSEWMNLDDSNPSPSPVCLPGTWRNVYYHTKFIFMEETTRKRKLNFTRFVVSCQRHSCAYLLDFFGTFWFLFHMWLYVKRLIDFFLEHFICFLFHFRLPLLYDDLTRLVSECRLRDSSPCQNFNSFPVFS